MTRKNPKSHTPAPRLGIASTIAAAASKTKLPMEIVQSAKAEGCGAFKTNGRIDCDALLEFAATRPKTDAPNYFLERALDIRANRQLKEQKLAERAKQLWPIEKIRRDWTRNVIATKTKLTAAESSIAAECGMRLSLTSDQVSVIREVTMKHLRMAQKELNAGEWGKTECPNCKKEII